MRAAGWKRRRRSSRGELCLPTAHVPQLPTKYNRDLLFLVEDQIRQKSDPVRRLSHVTYDQIRSGLCKDVMPSFMPQVAAYIYRGCLITQIIPSRSHQHQIWGTGHYVTRDFIPVKGSLFALLGP